MLFSGGVPGKIFGRCLGPRCGTVIIHRNDYKRFRSNVFLGFQLHAATWRCTRQLGSAARGNLAHWRLGGRRLNILGAAVHTNSKKRVWGRPPRPRAETWTSWEIIVFPSDPFLENKKRNLFYRSNIILLVCGGLGCCSRGGATKWSSWEIIVFPSDHFQSKKQVPKI